MDRDAAWARLDRLESDMLTMPQMECPVEHRFTPGMYIRQIFMPAGALVVSKIHKTEHPFVISMGDVSVWTHEDGVVRCTAPYTGITKPGTRRLLYMHLDTLWTTFHVTDLTDVDEIEREIIWDRGAIEQGGAG